VTQRLIDPRPSLAGRAGRAALRAVGLHPHDPACRRFDLAGRRALCIATNHGVLDVGVPTGLYGSELTAPYYAFLDAGIEVDVASVAGGLVPVEPLSMREPLRTEQDDRMLADDELRAKLARSLAIAGLDFTRYDLVYFAGGWGAAFDLGQSDLLGEKVSEAAAAGRLLGGVCHGPLGLLKARKANGEPLVAGRRLTAVTDRQVRQLGVTITPLHPESALRAAGALFEGRTHPLRDFFANHVVVDGDLVTGQNQNAGPMVARLLMERLVSRTSAVTPATAVVAN
jgi:putative intracellular protease/amidase